MDRTESFSIHGAVMPQSLAQISLHLVFSTKEREPYFVDSVTRTRVHDYLFEVSKTLGCQPKAVGGYTDHVHLLLKFSRVISVADFVRDLKRDSSKWVKTLTPEWNHFQWQAGYGVFSLSSNHAEALTAYIHNQEAHHQRVSFQEEFRRICLKNDIEIDERYAWE